MYKKIFFLVIVFLTSCLGRDRISVDAYILENDLHNAKINLNCGIKILSYWVKTDGVIASENGKNTGGSRFWSVLRFKNGLLNKIRTHTLDWKFCI